jgi:hypothetical protein
MSGSELEAFERAVLEHVRPIAVDVTAGRLTYKAGIELLREKLGLTESSDGYLLLVICAEQQRVKPPL